MKKILEILNFLFPPSLKFIWLGVICSTLLFSIFRILLALYFWGDSQNMSLTEFLHSLYLGARFDLRLGLLIYSIFFILIIFPFSNPWQKIKTNFYSIKFWGILFCFQMTIIFVIYIVDASNYAWLKSRLNYQTLSFAQDFNEALFVIWQSYPVIYLSIFLLFLVFVIYWLFTKLLTISVTNSKMTNFNNKSILIQIIYFAGLTLCHFCLYAGLMHGSTNSYSLRWSDTSVIKNSFAQTLAINPVQNIIDSFKYTEKSTNFAELLPYRNTIIDLYGDLPNFDEKINNSSTKRHF